MIFVISFLLAAYITFAMAVLSTRMDRGLTYFFMCIIFFIMMVISSMILGIHVMLTN